jgi:hypothetical protein
MGRTTLLDVMSSIGLALFAALTTPLAFVFLYTRVAWRISTAKLNEWGL